MKALLLLLLAMALQAAAATAPTTVYPESATATAAPVVGNAGAGHPAVRHAVKHPFFKKWYKLVRRKAARVDEGEQRFRKKMAKAALITGGMSVVLLFIVPTAGLLLAPAAIVTGVLGMKNNTDRKSRAFASLGLSLGVGVVFVALLVALLFIAFFNFTF